MANYRTVRTYVLSPRVPSGHSAGVNRSLRRTFTKINNLLLCYTQIPSSASLRKNSGIHSKPHKDPNKLTIRALMPYIEELAGLGLQISGWLDMSNEWAAISETPGSPGDHLQQLLMEWLNGEEDPDVPHTWKHFISVVRNCKRGKLAEKMEREVFGSSGGLHSYHSEPAEVHETSITLPGADSSPPTQSGPIEVHKTSTTVQGADSSPPTQSGPTEVHETSTTVQGADSSIDRDISNIFKLFGSKMSADPSDLQIMMQLSGYRYFDQTTKHVQAVMKNFPALKLTRKNFVHQNGTEEELASLCGTIPVHIQGSTYNIPVGIYLPKDYPHHCPTCLVLPTADMVISPSQYVNSQGMVSLPYLHDWEHTQSDLTTLIQIMSAAFSERSPVYSMGIGVFSSTDRQIMIRLSGYRHVTQTTWHIQAVLKNFPFLKLTRKNFVYQNGAEEELACLCGTIPVHIKGSTYDIPVGIYLRKNYPHHCPTCLVLPTSDMVINPSQYVNTQGMVFLPYLHEWKHTQSDLTTLIQIMSAAFGERFPVYSMGIGVSSSTDHQIRIQLSGYRYFNQTMEHVQAVMKNFPALKLTRKNFVHQNGAEEELACLCGTIPVHIKGSTYDIPVGIYLYKDYPHHCPTCLVQPTPDMRINPSQYVNTQGMVSLPYLHEWKHTQSDLTTLIQIMMIAFSERSPVFAWPCGKQQDHNIED